MLIPHKGHTDTIQVYSVTVMTHVKALQAGHSSQGTSEPITPVFVLVFLCRYGYPHSVLARVDCLHPLSSMTPISPPIQSQFQIVNCPLFQHLSATCRALHSYSSTIQPPHTKLYSIRLSPQFRDKHVCSVIHCPILCEHIMITIDSP